ncbi:MAG: glycine cleavage system aminomethyltransferase GcvT [Longimicrobiales bacterium]
MSGPETLARTPLHAEHERLGGRLVAFAGFELPVQYGAGIVAEHRAVRQAAGVFDVSHMGEFEVRGPDALALLQHVTTNDVARLEIGQAQYTVLCDARGGALDDCLLYRLEEHYMLVVNAANRAKDHAWITGHAGRFDADVADRSDEIALIALQGPAAQQILAGLTDTELDGIGYYRSVRGEVAARGALISRTGYTGEDGFELYLDGRAAVHVWRAVLEAGEAVDALPAGLGARDSLRLEMGYILYGNDLDEAHTPLEAGLGWIVKLDKGEFIGRDPLLAQKEAGIEQRLAGVRLVERGFPRAGYEIRIGDVTAGTLASGGYGPSVACGIGLGYVGAESSAPGTAVEIVIRGDAVPGVVVRPPFYTDGTLRR